MQVARNHFLAGAGLAEDQHAGVGIGHLLHHLAHVLNGAAGAHKAAEQVGFAMATAFAGLVVHLAIDLGTVQGIEQFAVAGRHFQVESTRRRWSSGRSIEEISPISNTGRNSSQVDSVFNKPKTAPGAFTVPISTQMTSRLDDNELTACCQSWLPQGKFSSPRKFKITAKSRRRTLSSSISRILVSRHMQ